MRLKNNSLLNEINYVSPHDLYFNTWEGQKIVDIPIQDALRNGYFIVNLEENKKKKLLNFAQSLNLDNLMTTAFTLERLDGGCALFIGYKDEIDLSLPPQKNAEIEFLKIIPRDSIEIINENNFNLLLKDSFVITMNGENIHNDRWILFTGEDKIIQSTFNSIWSESVLKRLKHSIILANNIREEIYYILLKSRMIIASAEKFSTRNSKRMEELKEALKFMNNHRPIIIDGEKVQFHSMSTPFSGLSELLLTYLKVLGSGADFPITRFLGLSNSGLTQSAEGDLENHYNNLAKKQKNHLGPMYLKVYKKLYMSLFGDDSEANLFNVDFLPLWNQSAEEIEKTNMLKLDKIIKALQLNLLSADGAINEINFNNIFREKLNQKSEEKTTNKSDNSADLSSDNIA
jgi:phage-related protein (TIGR01555 family)